MVALGQGDKTLLQRGDQVRVYYRASQDAYVAIFHIDTDGTTRLAFPHSPDENHYVRGVSGTAGCSSPARSHLGPGLAPTAVGRRCVGHRRALEMARRRRLWCVQDRAVVPVLDRHIGADPDGVLRPQRKPKLARTERVL
jgi:hypothetical protein